MNTTYRQELERIAGCSFFSAGQIRRELGVLDGVARMIVAQPGYRRGEEMMIAIASGGGWRLYCRIDGQWMDASLHDM